MDNNRAHMTPTGDSPFVLTRATCPICRTVNEFETIRPGAYNEEGIDTDFRPQTRRWANPRYQAINPLLFFMATCTTCYYTQELNRIGTDSRIAQLSKDDLNSVRQRHLTQLADANGIQRRLGAALWPESYPTQTAIAKFLLAVFSEMLNDSPRDSDLARWYLRMAWLFRDLNPGTERSTPVTHCHRELKLAVDEFAADLRRLRARLNTASKHFTTHPEVVQVRRDDQQSTSQCRATFQQLGESVSHLDSLVHDLHALVSRDAGPVIAALGEPQTEAFGEYTSFTEFFRSLKLDSPLVPLNEDEAMLHALSHFKRPFEAKSEDGSIPNQMLAAYMIGELSRRLGRFDDAERHLIIAREAASRLVAESGLDRAGTALARHMVTLANGQIRHLNDLATTPDSEPNQSEDRKSSWGEM